MSQSFESLGLLPELVRAVAEEGYTQPTPVQLQAIPVILEGRDVLAGAQTGTGKTAGFTLPMLQRLARHAHHGGRHAVRALVLTPTRELAAQVEESVRTYGQFMKLRSALVYGGVGMQPQVDALHEGVDVLVATPGRLLDHVGQKTVNLSHVEILVLDEADRMLDMGFIHDIRKILALLPAKRQNLLFSATFSDEIRELANGLLHDPVHVQVARRNAESELVSQRVYRVDQANKRHLLAHLVKSGDWHQVLVFTRTKHGANRLAEQLERAGVNAAAIHGNKSQNARTRALAGFKSGDVRVLVATDIAARGLDIEELPHVVNFELPNVPEDYVHRIGRTGRAGCTGEAISLVCAEEDEFLADIEKLLKRRLPTETVLGFEPGTAAPREPQSARPQPSHPRAEQRGQEERGRGGRRRGGRKGQQQGSRGQPPQGPRSEQGPRTEQPRPQGAAGPNPQAPGRPTPPRDEDWQPPSHEGSLFPSSGPVLGHAPVPRGGQRFKQQKPQQQGKPKTQRPGQRPEQRSDQQPRRNTNRSVAALLGGSSRRDD